MPHKGDIDPDQADLKAVYLTAKQARDLAEKIARHVVSESEPERGVLYRLTNAERDIENNSRDIRSIKSIPLRLAWVAVAAIVGTAAVGTATIVWNARPAAKANP